MTHELNHLKSLYEKGEYLQNLLIERATGESPSDEHYQYIRQEILSNNSVVDIILRWIKANRNLSQFGLFIKSEHDNYAARRRFIWNAFNLMLSLPESSVSHPAQRSIVDALNTFDSETIHSTWAKALEKIIRSRGSYNKF